jgi:trimethylamine--corrinoid protein Co-methyltransferase
MFPALRPKANLLSAELADRIIDEGFTVLERTGVFIENPEARSLLGEAGADIEPGRERVRIPRRLAEEFLRHAPETIALFDRSGNREYSLGAELSRIMRANASRNGIDRLPAIGG